MSTITRISNITSQVIGKRIFCHIVKSYDCSLFYMYVDLHMYLFCAWLLLFVRKVNMYMYVGLTLQSVFRSVNRSILLIVVTVIGILLFGRINNGLCYEYFDE